MGACCFTADHRSVVSRGRDNAPDGKYKRLAEPACRTASGESVLAEEWDSPKPSPAEYRKQIANSQAARVTVSSDIAFRRGGCSTNADVAHSVKLLRRPLVFSAQVSVSLSLLRHVLVFACSGIHWALAAEASIGFWLPRHPFGFGCSDIHCSWDS
eukprot:scpid59245/ scgid34729/ 